jgi:hypothetical protein
MYTSLYLFPTSTSSSSSSSSSSIPLLISVSLTRQPPPTSSQRERERETLWISGFILDIECNGWILFHKYVKIYVKDVLNNNDWMCLYSTQIASVLYIYIYIVGCCCCSYLNSYGTICCSIIRLLRESPILAPSYNSRRESVFPNEWVAKESYISMIHHWSYPSPQECEKRAPIQCSAVNRKVVQSIGEWPLSAENGKENRRLIRLELAFRTIGELARTLARKLTHKEGR